MKTVIGENLDGVMRTLQIDRFAKDLTELKRYINTAGCIDADYNNTACAYCDNRYSDGKCYDICPHNSDRTCTECHNLCKFCPASSA